MLGKLSLIVVAVCLSKVVAAQGTDCSSTPSTCDIRSSQAGVFSYCVGSTITLSATSISTIVTSHTWQIQSGSSFEVVNSTSEANVQLYPGTCGYVSTRSITVGAGTNTFLVTPSCGGSPMEITVVGITKPAVAIELSPSTTNPTDICEGQTITLLSKNAFSDYSWSKTISGVTTVGFSTSTSITASQTGSFSLSAKNECGILQTFSIDLTFTPVLANVAIGGAPPSICYGTTSTILSPLGDHAQYFAWSISDNDPNHDATVNGGVISWNGLVGNANVSLTAYGCNGSSITVQKSIAVTQPPLNCSISFASDLVRCAGVYTLAAQSTSADVSSHRWFDAAQGGNELTVVQEQRFGAWVSELRDHFFDVDKTYWVEPVCSCQTTAVERIPVKFAIDRGQALKITVGPQGQVPYDLCEGDLSTVLTGTGSTTGVYEWRLNDPFKSSPDFTTQTIHPVVSGNYSLRGVNSCNEWVETSPVTVKIRPVMKDVLATWNQESFCTGTLAESRFELSGENVDAFIWSISSPNHTMSEIGQIVADDNKKRRIIWNPAFHGTVNVSVVTEGCANSTQEVTWPSFQIYDTPNVTMTPAGTVSVPFDTDFVTLTANSSGTVTYQWYKGTFALSPPTGGENILRVKNSGYYSVLAVDQNNCKAQSSSILVQFQGSKNVLIDNTILTDTLHSGATIEEQHLFSLDVGQRSQRLTYVNGLGYPMQMIDRQASPRAFDVVSPILSDPFGRERFKLLPYVANSVNGQWKDTLEVIQSQRSFYQTGAAGVIDNDPYSEVKFDESPLNRAVKIGAPGTAWQLDSGHAIQKQYLFNGPTDVRLFLYDPDTGLLSLTPGAAMFYAEGTLMCVKTIDEHGNDILEYTDKAGKTVCKKVKADSTTYAETYYVYDELGNLVTVIPPEGVKAIISRL